MIGLDSSAPSVARDAELRVSAQLLDLADIVDSGGRLME
ncbi:hypothetical protein D779_2746 [Imhoffiella purpurea]|uniref:Uncharacterized protein n=1 Tax=Imhoffiella purpurea TaxID=1249627 RepID=W9VVD5_9GAMM|nr:hypothetical protein D779_2746 [Imhoffiella purpurea]